jgi:hypothetical protein
MSCIARSFHYIFKIQEQLDLFSSLYQGNPGVGVKGQMGDPVRTPSCMEEQLSCKLCVLSSCGGCSGYYLICVHCLVTAQFYG